MPIQDAFSAGVEPGGLYTSQEIKILICYMLLGVGEPMERQMVTELIAGNGMANFFETAAAVDELARQGHLTEKEGRISLTETGRQVGDTLAGMIPYTLRERSVKAALQLLTRIRREQAVFADIQPGPDVLLRPGEGAVAEALPGIVRIGGFPAAPEHLELLHTSASLAASRMRKGEAGRPSPLKRGMTYQLA